MITPSSIIAHMYTQACLVFSSSIDDIWLAVLLEFPISLVLHNRGKDAALVPFGRGHKHTLLKQDVERVHHLGWRILNYLYMPYR